MASAYVFDGDSLHQVMIEEGRLTYSSVASPLPCRAVVACFGEKEFYYVDPRSPDLLQRHGNGSDFLRSRLPGPVSRLIVHRHKVYCCGRNCLYAFDPLSRDVETLELHHNVLDVDAAGHGFVFVNEFHELYVFHFNNSIRKVETRGEVIRLLGQQNGFVMALFDSNRVVAINENGEVREGTFTLAISTPFISLSGGALLTCQESGELCLYTQNALVSSVVFQGHGLRPLLVPSSAPEGSCLICFCDFDDGTGVTLDCGHRFHRECLANFSSRADGFVAKGEHVAFTYALCPAGCGFMIRHPAAPLSEYMRSLSALIDKDLEQRLREMANKTAEDLLYYICFQCGKPFYGGERWCFRLMSDEPAKAPRELLCSNCNKDFLCPKHKHDFVLYKCRYCCNPASHLSFGNRYMCNRCEGQWKNAEPEPVPCPGPKKCPLKGSHKTDGSYPLGCMLCMPLDGLGASLFSAS
ncbi:excreted/secreted protein 66 [Trypanosoma grayi]|uniref:excreted/secreted protein 66 n=1 Tax=Trypanosoma grayi TaxID=71804 RepID=UPI0004F4A3C0|nr:excreted/secreted protein 66 [Trypanosoma grayi]KEG08785.1 excreted/secreted protein 66 [Trypanosoma grayi]